MHLAPGRWSWRRRERPDHGHIISVLLENEAGALSRVAGLFSARGYNIESLTVAPTDDPTLSRMTLVTTGQRRDRRADQEAAQQADRRRQAARPVRGSPHRARDDADQGARRRPDREELKRLAEIFRAKIIDVTDASYVIELTGAPGSSTPSSTPLPKGLIVEVVRSGPTGIARGEKRPDALSSGARFVSPIRLGPSNRAISNARVLRQRRRPVADPGQARSRSSVTAPRATPTPTT